MNDSEERGLQRADLSRFLPVGIDELPKEDQIAILKKIAEGDVEVRKELAQKLGQSQIAEHDIAVMIEAVRHLDHERKIYSEHAKGQTGTGSYDIHIRGGDTRFIIPILIVVGVLILALVLILTLAR